MAGLEFANTSGISAAEIDEISQNCEGIIRTGLEKLVQIWVEVGLSAEEKKKRSGIVKRHISTLMADMIHEETDFKCGTIAKVEAAIRDLRKTTKELGLNSPAEDEDTSIPLLQLLSKYEAELKYYHTIKDKRLSKLAELRKAEKDLSERLGLEPYYISNKVPTEEQLAKFKEYIELKTVEKRKMEYLFQTRKSAIIKLMEELEMVPRNDTEKMITIEDDKAFILTPQNMDKVSALHQELEQKIEDRANEVARLREKLSYLWDRLQIDAATREAVLSENTGHCLSSMRGLQTEIDRCEELKKQNMKEFIKVMREEIRDWWTRMCYSTDQSREEFPAFFSENYSEDLVELHELELDRLRKHYERNRNIYLLIAEHEKLYKQLLKLDDKAHDPNRYQNRGGQLLQEEKERKKIQKDLPKIKGELFNLIDAWEEENRKEFLIRGNNCKDAVESQWKQYEDRKNNERMTRKTTRIREIEEETRLGSKANTTKRKLPRTPAPLTPKNRRLGGTELKYLEIRPPPSFSRSRTRPVQNENIHKQTSSEGSPTSSVASYTDFTTYLERKNEELICRSSVAAGPTLRVPRTPKSLGTHTQSHSRVLTPYNRNTPVKPPRKNMGTPKTPMSVPRMTMTPSRQSRVLRSVATTPRLTTARGRLPIII